VVAEVGSREGVCIYDNENLNPGMVVGLEEDEMGQRTLFRTTTTSRDRSVVVAEGHTNAG
jgi:hypothetical protein